MCEFCKHSTDYSADEVQFFNEVAKSPIMINDVEAALLVLSGNWSDWTNGPILDVEFLGYEYNPVLAEIMQPINYCPICGKQLRPDSEVASCEYCKHNPEDSDDETHFINFVADKAIVINGKDIANMSLMITNTSNGGPRLEIELYSEFVGTIAKVKYPIHYCPFCGKKLD